MEINFEVLLEYLNTIGSATVSLDLNDKLNPTIKVQRGSYYDNSGVQVHLEICDLVDILKINGVTGENGTVKRLLSESRNFNSDNEKVINLSKNIDDCWYGTLGKYITQLLFASNGKNLYPEIKCLEKHKDYFMKE